MALPRGLGVQGRRGSLPLPPKPQLRREAAVEEPDAGPGPRDQGGPYRLVLLGEHGVGKTALATAFAGTPPGPHPDDEPHEDSYERRLSVDDEEVTLILYDIGDQGEAGGWLQESCVRTGDAFLLVFSVTDRGSFSRLAPALRRLRADSPRPDLPIILVANKSDLARAREVSLEEGRSLAVMLSCKHIETSAALQHNTQELFEGAVRQIRLRRGQPGGNAAGGRRESLTEKAKRFLSSLVPRNGRFFKQRSKSCNDLSVL